MESLHYAATRKGNPNGRESGSPTVSALVSERFGLEPWPGTLCCVLLKITVPLSILVYKWVLANLMLGITLR